jgi:dolichol-phosphate mannosyltransferase
MTKTKLPELSIFFPFWNEEKNIETTVQKAIPVAKEIADKWEILMIDDGSSDNTLKIGSKLAKLNKNLRIISHFPNRGYGAALKEGLLKSKYKYIVFNDGDGQFDFFEIYKFAELINNSDMVIGYRKKRNDSNIIKRLLLMNLLKIWNIILFRFYFRDTDCGFKMFTRDCLDKIGPLRSEGAMITTEILAKAKKKKLKIKEVGVNHFPRTHGVQSGANFPVILRAVLESLQLWYDLHYGRT